MAQFHLNLLCITVHIFLIIFYSHVLNKLLEKLSDVFYNSVLCPQVSLNAGCNSLLTYNVFTLQTIALKG